MPRHALLQCLSLDHQSADVTLRGLLACSPEQTNELLCDPARPKAGAFILSTCNRIELYWIGDATIADWWRARALALGVAIPFVHRSGRNAARHMVRVASGLESRMLGEREILGQMRTAIHRSRLAGTLGRRLGMIGDGAIAGARRVRRASVLDRHARAASAAMVDWAVTQMGGSLRGRAALVLGAGEAAEGALRALVEHGAGRIVLANRNLARAEALATRYPALVETAAWEQLEALTGSADIIITATAAADPILGVAHLSAAGALRPADPVHVLDLGVPANVELAARGLPGVRVADLDALRSATCPDTTTSAVALAEADKLVEREVRMLARDVRARRLARTLAQLHALGEMVAAEEADLAIDALDGLTDAERAICQQMGAKVARRILYRVSRILREESVQPRRRPVGAV